MADNGNKATFRASIPPIMSGIKTGGDGMRFQLDVPESDMAEAVKLLTMRGKVLQVTIEPVTLRNDEAEKIPTGNGDSMAGGRLSLRRNQ